MIVRSTLSCGRFRQRCSGICRPGTYANAATALGSNAGGASWADEMEDMPPLGMYFHLFLSAWLFFSTVCHSVADGSSPASGLSATFGLEHTLASQNAI